MHMNPIQDGVHIFLEKFRVIGRVYRLVQKDIVCVEDEFGST